MTNTTTHPIDHTIALLLIAFEGICWVINELTGGHTKTDAIGDTPELDAKLLAALAPITEEDFNDPREVAIEAGFTFYEDATFTGGSHDLDWEDISEDYHHLATLTVKELRKQAKGLAKGIHLMKKDQLITLLA